MRVVRDERYEDAEQAAELLLENYPDIPEAKDMLAQIRTRRLIDGATDALYASDEPACDECERANELMTEALELSPDYEGAQFIKEDIDACLARCKTGRLPFVILLLLLAGTGAGLVYLARSGNLLPRLAGAFKGSGESPVPGGPAARGWVLEGIDGACRGQVFPLEKAELVIGSKGPPEGVADIVILDAQRKISRRHCTVMQNGKQFYLMDESTNGTSLNGQPAARGTYVEFRAGDHISLADVAVPSACGRSDRGWVSPRGRGTRMRRIRTDHAELQSVLIRLNPCFHPATPHAPDRNRARRPEALSAETAGAARL